MMSPQEVIDEIHRFSRGDAVELVDADGQIHPLTQPVVALDETTDSLRFTARASNEPPLVLATSQIAGLRNAETAQRVWQIAFFDHLPVEVSSSIARFVTPLAGSGAPLGRAALLSSPGAVHPELKPLVDALGPDRGWLRSAVEVAFREPSDLLLGWLLAAGLCADTATVLLLGDLLVGNREPNVGRRAAFAVEALRLCGTTEAHMQIQRAGFEALEADSIGWARQALLGIAGEKKVQVWEVEDELAPACGLSREAIVVDYGRRGFELALDDHLAPFLREPQQRERFYDAPTALPEEDPHLVEAGRARWLVLREQLQEAAPVQVHRLEEALVQEYRWDAARWIERVWHHPLLKHLAVRCVWGLYSASGRRLHTSFRVDRDGTLWGADDEPFELDPEEATVGVVHPLDLDDDTKRAWGSLLSDYEVVTLFPQIDRPIYRWDPEDAKSTTLELGIDASALPFDVNVHLHRRGWRVFERWHTQLAKTFRQRNIRARVDVDYDDGGVAKVGSLWFERYLGYPNTTFQFRDVPAIVYSEARLEFEALRSTHDTGAFSAIGTFGN